MQARLEAIPQPDKDVMYATPNFQNIKQLATKQTMLYQLCGIRLEKFEHQVNEEWETVKNEGSDKQDKVVRELWNEYKRLGDSQEKSAKAITAEGDRMSAEMKKMGDVVGSLDTSKKERFLAKLGGDGELGIPVGSGQEAVLDG